jgi:hypothetical protein
MVMVGPHRPFLSRSGRCSAHVFGAVTITFTSIRFPTPHHWALAAMKDTTMVMNVSPTIGYSEKW